MRIVLDLQACQSASRFRGIGRYSLALAQALARNAASHEIWLALNGYMADTVMPIRQAFYGLVPSERISVFSIPGPVAELGPANTWRARAAELVREHALAELAPDFVHVASLFEGWADDVVTSIGALDSSIATAATLYDLIPLKHSKTHLRSPGHRDWYFRKLDSLKKANLLLAISDFSRCEAIAELGISPDRITNIAAGVGPEFRPVEVSESQRTELFNRYGIARPFLLYTGNLEPHKNLEGAIRGFAAIAPEVRRAHQLVIVSQMDDVHRGRLQKLVAALGMSERDVLLTGYVTESELVLLYNLCKAFVFPSLYEGFGLPALEAMACGAPTIGSRAASIPEVIGRDDALFDPTFTPSIAGAMHRVLADDGFRESLRAHARTQRERFSWDDAARRAIDALEEAWGRLKAQTGTTVAIAPGGRYQALLNKFGELSNALCPTDDDLRSCAASVSFNEVDRSEKQLLVDVSALAVQDAGTGIQRVVRSILSHLLSHPPEGFRVEPVYGDDGGFYRYAHRFLRRFQGLDHEVVEDLPIDARRGDIFLGLDLSAHLFPVFRPVLAHFQRVGVGVYFVVYDVIPLLYPQWCAQGMPQAFATWMEAISAHADGLVCISASVADEVRLWLKDHQPSRADELKIGYFHLGADIDNSIPSLGMPDGAAELLKLLSSTPSFLMVGTIEPRKGHAQVLDAFEHLWAWGVDANLVIVGKAGWNVGHLTERLCVHPERGKRLHWLEGISDEYLEMVYQASSALIAPSEAEGFGLPLIEAAQHKLPIIARDIPVFREVAGEHAFYFSGKEFIHLAAACQEWMRLNAMGNAPQSQDMPWLTWAKSAQELFNVIFDKNG